MDLEELGHDFLELICRLVLGKRDAKAVRHCFANGHGLKKDQPLYQNGSFPSRRVMAGATFDVLVKRIGE